jgi:PPOX class probable F420-dependent enzyme
MSRRDQIRMTEAETDAFLAGRRTMSVATVGPSGHPHVVAMWYGFLDGVPAFWTYGKSQKIANLRRDPKLSCLVEDGETYDELRGVEIVGSGLVVDDPEVVLRLGCSIYARYFGELNEAAREAVAVMGAKRVVVRIEAEKIVSWDHAKLGGTY